MNNKRVKLGVGIAIFVVLIALIVTFFENILDFISYMAGLFFPFLLGAVLAFAGNPLANFLERKCKIPRNIASISVILIFLGVIGGICAALVAKIFEEIQSIYQDPEFLPNLEGTFNNISASLEGMHARLPGELQQIVNSVGERIIASFTKLLSDESVPIVESAGNIAKSIPGFFIGTIVFVLSSFFMLNDAPKMKKSLRGKLSDKTWTKLSKMKSEFKCYVGGYVKAQLIIMCIVFVILFVGLSVLGVNYAMLIAAVTALFDALPFFGSGAVLITWAVICFFTSEASRAVGLLIIYLCVIFTRQMIEPKIVSRGIGMNPLLTLMSMYIGYRLFSIGGMIVGPLLMMTFISLKRAGFFDGIIEFFSLAKKAAKREISNMKNQLKE